MLTTLISFLGGTAFRLIFGGVMDYFKSRQEHTQEIELQKLQAELETARMQKDMERLRLQAELQVKEVTVATDSAIQKDMADAFVEAVKATGQKTGITWVDAWNGMIRPFGATISLGMWVFAFVVAGFTLTENDWTLISAFIGIFVGDRIHTKGKL